ESLEATLEPLPSRFSVTNSEDWFWTCSYSKIAESLEATFELLLSRFSVTNSEDWFWTRSYSKIGASCISLIEPEGDGMIKLFSATICFITGKFDDEMVAMLCSMYESVDAPSFNRSSRLGSSGVSCIDSND